MLVYCIEITAMHRDIKEVAPRKSITKLLYSTNELWSRAGKSKWHSRFKNSILVFSNHWRWFVLNWVVSPNTQNQSLICEEIVLLIIQYPFLTALSSHCMFDVVNPLVKLGTFVVIKYFVLLWPKLKFKEICCPGWIITKWVSFVHTCKVHISKKLYKSFQSNLMCFYRERKLISAAKIQRKFVYIIHNRKNLKWIHRKHRMRIHFMYYKLSWMQEKGAVLFQLILHIETGGDYHTLVKYEDVPVFTSGPGTANSIFGPSIHPVQLSACSDASVWVSAHYRRDFYSWIYWWNLFLVCFCALPASLSAKKVQCCHLRLHLPLALTITSFRDLKAEEKPSKTPYLHQIYTVKGFH